MSKNEATETRELVLVKAWFPGMDEAVVIGVYDDDAEADKAIAAQAKADVDHFVEKNPDPEKYPKVWGGAAGWEKYRKQQESGKAYSKWSMVVNAPLKVWWR